MQSSQIQRDHRRSKIFPSSAATLYLLPLMFQYLHKQPTIIFYCDWINGSSRYKSKVLHPPTEINLKVHLPSFANVSINFHLFSLCPKMFPACSASHQAKFRGLARSHLFVCFCAFLYCYIFKPNSQNSDVILCNTLLF